VRAVDHGPDEDFDGGDELKSGADWYKREPVAYLGGVQGLTAKQHAVYAVVIELIYMHGGSINNDPSWVAGWISDMGSHAVRTTIQALVDKRKLIIEGTQITQKTAKTQAKTREETKEKRRESGEKGGKNSGKSRREMRKNKDLNEASASTREEKIREEKSYGGGGDAGARDPDPPPKHMDAPTERERLLIAMGCDRSGIAGPSGKMIGRMADMQMVERWKSDLGMTLDEILGVIEEVMAGKPEPGPPSTFAYFTAAMRRFSGVKSDGAKLIPITGDKTRGNIPDQGGEPAAGRTPSNSQHRSSAALLSSFSRALHPVRSGSE
jgi:hypothetical protein